MQCCFYIRYASGCSDSCCSAGSDEDCGSDASVGSDDSAGSEGCGSSPLDTGGSDDSDGSEASDGAEDSDGSDGAEDSEGAEVEVPLLLSPEEAAPEEVFPSEEAAPEDDGLELELIFGLDGSSGRTLDVLWEDVLPAVLESPPGTTRG